MSSTQTIHNSNTDLYRNDVHDLVELNMQQECGRAARVHRYKEERRRQLESQFHDLSSPSTVTHTNSLKRRYITRSHKTSSSTRTSASTTNNGDEPQPTSTTRTVPRTAPTREKRFVRVGQPVMSSDSDNVSDLITSNRVNSSNSDSTMTASTTTSSSAVLGAPGGVRTTRTSRLRTNNINNQQHVDNNIQQRVLTSPGAITNTIVTGQQSKSCAEKSSSINSRLPNGSQTCSDHYENKTTVAAAAATSSPRRSHSLRSTTLVRPTTTPTPPGGTDKDKSAKRKSNLNRSLNTEEVAIVPSNNYDNLIVNQRRRHLAPITVPINSSSTTMLNNKSLNQHQLIENNQPQSINKMNRKPSQLSIHMENARRSISTLTSSSKENNTKRLNATSPRGTGGSLTNTNTIKQIKKSNDDTVSSSTTNSDREKSLRKTNNSSLNKKSSTENLTKIKKTTGLSTQRRGSESSTRYQSKQTSSASANSRPSPTKERINEISRRMDSLTQLTRNTIARVEHLASTRQVLPGASSPASTTSTVTAAIGTNKKDLNNQLDSKLMTDKQIININNNKNINNNVNNINHISTLNNGAQQTQTQIKNVPPSCLLASTNSSCSNNSPSDQRDCATIINEPTQNMVSGATESHEIIMMPSILKKKSSIDHHELSILKQIPSSMSSIPPSPMMTSTKEDTKPQTTAAPISILKRKTSQDENGALIGSGGGSSSTGGESCSHHHHHHIVTDSHSSSCAPVTFSPSVVDPPTASRRRQSILKKRRSLDESEVLRRRSCSPDVTILEGTTTADFRSILKQHHQQRRSSLEELRVGSPEPQGILKRKTSRGSDDYNTAAPGGSTDDRSVSVGSPEPQSILKRKSGSNSSGGGSNITQHVSIAAAVILAAASGAEIINFNGEQENVRPILKKKSISSDESPNISEIHDPKPILKTKESSDDYCDERPKKSILKVSSRNHDSSSLEYNSDNETTTTSSTSKRSTSLRTRSSESSSSFETNSPVRKLSTRTTSITTCDEELVSILKQSSCSPRESSPRPRLSFCDDGGGEQQTSSSMSRSSPPPGLHPGASEDDDGPGASHPGEHTFLRRPSMSPIYRSRSSGSDYDERYRKRRTIHLGEGERFFDDSNIRLRRQSMSDMADSIKSNSLGGPGGGQHLHSASGMSVAERILRMETFLAQEQKTDKHDSNYVIRRRSSLHNKSNTAMDIIGGTAEMKSSSVASTSSSTSSVTTIINKNNNNNNSNQSLLDGSQIICSQNGGNETTSNHTQSDRQESNTTSSSSIIQNTEEQTTSSNINNKQVAANNNNTNQLLLSTSSSSQSSEILNSDLFTNSKLTMSSSILLNHESSAIVGDEEESLGQEVVQEASTAAAGTTGGGGGDDQLDVVINSHSFDSGCIEDDVQNVDGGAAPGVSNTKEQTHVDEDEQPQSSHDRDRRNSVSSRAAAFNKQAEEHQKAAVEAKKKNVSAGIERYKNRRALSNHKHSSDHAQRFNTQPVTYGEIQEAAKQNQQRNDIEEDDPSKLTIAERVKLFNEKMIEENRIKTNLKTTKPPPSIRKRYSNSRFKTQPVTCDEVQRAQQKIINPLIASFVKPPSSEQLDGLNIKQTKDKINEHAVRMLTTPGTIKNLQEMKGILKTSSTTPSTPTPSIRTINNESTAGEHEHVCDSSSAVKNSDRVVVSSSSECESSGEREIRTIIHNNNNRTVTTSSMLEVNKRVLSSSSSATPGDKKFITKSTSETTTQCTSFSNNTTENEEENTRKLKSQSKNNEKSIIIDIRDESLNCTTSCDENILEDEIKTKMPASVDDAPGGHDDDDAVDNINSPSISIAERRAALQHAGNNDWKRRIHPIHELTAGELKNIVITTTNNESTKHEETKNEIISTSTPGVSGGVGSSSVLADRVFKLETASQGWKKRVEQSDAINFTVAGRMRETNNVPIAVSPSLPNIPINAANKIKKTPKPARFKTKQERLENKNSDVTLTLTRSISVPNTTGTGNGDNEKNGLRVSVPRADDETFTSFYTSSFYEDDLLIQDDSGGGVIVTSEDLDVVTRTVQNDNYYLGRHKRIIKIHQRKHLSSKNPIKTLNARTDLQNEYTEIKTGIAEKELTRINAEKIAKNSNMAIAALAGLASKEDFTAINLKKTNTANTNTINSITFSMLPYNDLMLIHIKGRRHVQARLVEPVIASINRGDNYVLLTKTLIYNYQGLYSNIIEQSRAQEIALASALNGNRQIITIHEEKNTCSQKYIDEFWKLLGHNNNNNTDDTNDELLITDAGHPDEDEIYESKIIETNMMYELIIDIEREPQLIPYQKYWGCIPKIDMLDPNKIFIFDFGTELYVWNGKNSSLDRRKIAVKLAKELWQEGYDYTDCDICPINATQMLGANRNSTLNSISKKSNTRPSWALLAKITQNMEPVLFREKFLDWPDYSRVIKVKDDPQTSSTNIIIKPLDVCKMLEANTQTPDLILEGSHLGRGTKYYDEETNRLFEITTLSVKKWYIQEFEYFELPNSELNHFYSSDSYIIRWQYMATVTGRELSGKPSRHSLAGRDRCAYFCWQGKNASLNEKGAAALLTVELDHERGPQIRVTEGFEPPAFLNLFNGSMIIHSGKLFDNDLEIQNKDISVNNQSWRLYLCRGDLVNETFLSEVPCNMRQLRSRASMILINSKLSRIIIWHGAKTLEHTKQMARSAVDKLKSNESEYFVLRAKSIEEVLEGDETAELLNILGVEQEGSGGGGSRGGGRRLYMSLLNDPFEYQETPRLFCFSSVSSGVFESNEILCPYRWTSSSGDVVTNDGSIVTPYPFLQSDLYSASQPALFLLDNGCTLWLWQGWWPELDADSSSDDHPHLLSDQTGSGAIRWQEERRAAMQTTINYWRHKYGHHSTENEKKENEKCPAVLVWAGLEPLEFTNLFPTWCDRDDIAKINIKDGRKPGEILSLNSELERLTCCTYPASVLLQRPLPDGVDPTRLEEYLSPNHFQQMFNGLTKQQFYELPQWKQTNLKKEYGLF